MAASRSVCSHECEYAAEISFRRCLSLPPSEEDRFPKASRDKAWCWFLHLWSWAAARHPLSSGRAERTPSTGEKQEPHMLLSGHGSFLSEVYLGGHSWIIHSEQLFGCPRCCICLTYGCLWRGLCWEGEFQKVSELSLLPVLRNRFYFCLILVVFVRRTAGLVTAPGEIKLTEPICSHKINRSGLWV